MSDVLIITRKDKPETWVDHIQNRFHALGFTRGFRNNHADGTIDYVFTHDSGDDLEVRVTDYDAQHIFEDVLNKLEKANL